MKGLAAAPCAPLASWLSGCTPPPASTMAGGWVGSTPARGHTLRDGHMPNRACTDTPRRAAVAIVGGGIAGLSAARGLRLRGIDDFVLFELEDTAGGNSRGHTLGGAACPLGAHYLPTPGEAASEVRAWLHEIGVAREVHGRTVYDERMLCHSPQERLFVPTTASASTGPAGHWQEGLLPAAASTAAQQQYRRFAQAVREAQALGPHAFAMPTLHARWQPALTALDQQTFAQWLQAHGLDDAGLRWYLDYCCRDDYGAGLGQVSAWAGLHYFASRHGFRAPTAEADATDHDDAGVLTWPEGNAWLAHRLAAPLGERLRPASGVVRIQPQRHGVGLHIWRADRGCIEPWQVQQVIVALPLFVAARLIDPIPAPLQAVRARLRYAPWLVSNLLLREPLEPSFDLPLAWDNVLQGSPALGYINARHQSLSSAPQTEAPLLTHYWALGGQNLAELTAQRARLLRDDWRLWAQRVMADLATAHPDLPGKVERIDLARHAHAMCVPVPGLRSDPALQALAASRGRLLFAHSDLSAYSVFEEAFSHGLRAAARVS